MNLQTSIPIFSAILFLSVSLTHGQPNRLKVGDRVRISAPSIDDRPIVGNVVDYSSSVILVKTKRSKYSIPLNSVSKFEVSSGKRPAVLEGILIGMIAGSVIGITISDSKNDDTICTTDEGLCGLNLEGFEGAAYSILGGVLGGGLIGSMFKIDRWEKLSLQLSTVMVPPTHMIQPKLIGKPVLSVRIPIGKKYRTDQ